MAVLRTIEKGEFFRTIRAGLVTDLCNQSRLHGIARCNERPPA